MSPVSLLRSILRRAGLATLVLPALLCLVPLSSAEAHTLRPGFLILQESEPGLWAVSWTAPTVEPQLVPHVRGACTMDRNSSQWVVRCPEGSADSELLVRGIQRESTQVVVRIASLDGQVSMSGLGLGNESMSLDLSALPPAPGFGRWIVLGVEHILIGADHLLFVLGLVLLIATTRELLITITAFTLAHSITLGGASLGAFSLPSAPVEAVIALSIVLLAVELVKGDPESLSRRKTWLVAFAFGLLHGFGFAGALGDIGLPSDAVWLPLLAFNLGVEAGQLAFVAVILVPVLLIRKGPDWLSKLPPYGIGTVAAAWTIERVVGFWGAG